MRVKLLHEHRQQLLCNSIIIKTVHIVLFNLRKYQLKFGPIVGEPVAYLLPISLKQKKMNNKKRNNQYDEDTPHDSPYPIGIIRHTRL